MLFHKRTAPTAHAPQSETHQQKPEVSAVLRGMSTSVVTP